MGYDTGHAAPAPAAGPAEPRTFEPKDGNPDVKPDVKPKLEADVKPSVGKGKGKAHPTEIVDLVSSSDSDVEFIPKILPRDRVPHTVDLTSDSDDAGPAAREGGDVEMGEGDGDEISRASSEINFGDESQNLDFEALAIDPENTASDDNLSYDSGSVKDIEEDSELDEDFIKNPEHRLTGPSAAGPSTYAQAVSKKTSSSTIIAPN